MDKYRKLIAAAVGLIFMLVATLTDFKIPVGETDVVNIIVMVLTAIGVWAVPNAPTDE